MSENQITILDGGMSRELERLGAPFRQPEWSALALIETPEIVRQAHELFIRNGSEVITTNSYALVPFHIGETRFKNEALPLAHKAGEMARQAVEATQTGAQVAGSLPPLFGSYRPDLYQADQVDEIAAPLIQGLAPSVDLWLIETQSLIAEATAIKSAIDRFTDQPKPVWVSFTLEDSEPVSQPSIRSGETVKEAVQAMAEQNVQAILFNCCQPETIEDALHVARTTLAELGKDDIRLGAYANAFAPQKKDAAANEEIDEVRADLTPPAYVAWAEKWRSQGASLIGGCCGIGAEHIAELSQHLK
ncbi:homocysteine S-methyltransferase family protein [Vibrio mangrovi]|uniref:Homocysteine S-methyltransferase n=1 Tax=Vibrio mangrovi TaxID=474394 RepID=A0A1Y6IZ57_9VIBR|nr:homocysteine S-methyltransferase family protein [Vibrio mangrovi]MDW6005311.1 homocysteine S-methyltransferase family protein [Vibrio mangrovi]SMS02937.1 Homocysteine S-methyltransferase [Vibrio mangrovi]